MTVVRKKYRKWGEGNLTKAGYIVKRAGKGAKKFEHVLIAEAALGRPLPKSADVHHVDKNRANNKPNNLVICPSRAYHKLLHRRMIAMDDCGNPNYLKCNYCHQHDDPEVMYVSPRGQAQHRACRRIDQKARYRRKAWSSL